MEVQGWEEDVISFVNEALFVEEPIKVLIRDVINLVVYNFVIVLITEVSCFNMVQN